MVHDPEHQHPTDAERAMNAHAKSEIGRAKKRDRELSEQERDGGAVRAGTDQAARRQGKIAPR